MLNQLDEDFLRANFKDPSLIEPFIKTEKKRFIVLKMVITSFILMILASMGYAYTQRSHSTRLMEESERIHIQIEACLQEAQKQNELAYEAQRIAQEMNLKIQKQMEDCNTNEYEACRPIGP